jgi:hypothetical protein
MILVGVVMLLVLLSLGTSGAALDKFARRVCLAVLLMPAALIACMVLSFVWNSMAAERFYGAHPILQTMRQARDDNATINSIASGEALLRYVPIDTVATTALAALAREGFSCAEKPPSSGDHVECGLQVSESFGYTHWIVGLQFDDSALLTAATVTRWNISL